MYSTTASQFMDKQIMDLSNSQNNSATNTTDFVDFLRSEKKEDISPSYDFMPIRPAVGLSSPPATRLLNFDSGEDDAPIRTWNSLDSKKNASPIRSYDSLDADEPAKFGLGKTHKPVNTSSDQSLVSEIDRRMKKYVDDLMHSMDGLSARLSHLETKTHNLEGSMDQLKVSIGNNHGSTDGNIRQMANVLREVQTSVQLIKDKQEAVEGQFDIAKLIPKAEQEVQSRNTPQADSPKSGAPSYQQFPTNSVTQAPPLLQPPNAPFPAAPQQNLQSPPQLPNQFPQNQAPSAPQPEAYFLSPNQTPNHYQTPPPQHHQPPPAPLPQHHQPPPAPLPQHHQPPPAPLPQHHQPPPAPLPQHHQPPPAPLPQHHQPPPQQPYPPPSQPQYSPTPPPPPPSEPHPTLSNVNTSLPQAQFSHPPEEPPYTIPQTYPPPPTHTPSPPQQVYGSTHPGYSPPFGPTSSHGEPYPNYSSSTPPYGSGSPRKPQQGGGSGYPQIPTARILPQAVPTAASGTGGGSRSGNRVPVDDVVDKVANMGFSREQVRAAVQRLTDNGQAVDLNVVLDKLMNDADVQAPRGWYGR